MKRIIYILALLLIAGVAKAQTFNIKGELSYEKQIFVSGTHPCQVLIVDSGYKQCIVTSYPYKISLTYGDTSFVNTKSDTTHFYLDKSGNQVFDNQIIYFTPYK
jgi:hypothetical protein